MNFGERLGRKKVRLGSKPRLLVGTFIGTFFAFVMFLRHYAELKDESCACRRRASFFF